MLVFLALVGVAVWLLSLQGRIKVLEQETRTQAATIRSLHERLREATRTPPVEKVGEATAEVPVRPPVAAPTLSAQPPANVRLKPDATSEDANVRLKPVATKTDAPTPPLPPAAPLDVPLKPDAATTAPPPVPPRPPVPPVMRPSPPAVPPVNVPPTPDATKTQPFDWEALVGVKLFSWVAGVALALAAIFFLGYSIQNGWLQPPVRMAIGILVGLGLLVVCELRVARNYAVTANAMDAAGIVILFSTFFAAHSLWGLIGSFTTFAFLVLVTVVAVALSLRRDSIFVALLGLVGGFCTPALLSTGQDNPIGLFGYLLVLNAGLAWAAYRKRWTTLMALSLCFTTLYQWGWVFKFLNTGHLALAAGIFLVFPLLAAVAMAGFGRERRDLDEPDPTGYVPGRAGDAFRLMTAVNATLPLLFAVYLAGVPAYGMHHGLLFGFLLLVDAGLFVIALWRGPGVVHLIGGGTTVLVFVSWLASIYAGPATTWSWPASLGWTAVFVAFYLACGLTARHGARRLSGPATAAVYAAPALLVAFPILAANEPAFSAPGLGFSTLFVLLASIAAFAIWEAAGPVYFVAAFFALAAEAVWSGLHLEPGRLITALVIYGGFGLFYLGVPLLARRLGRALKPDAMSPVLLLASIALLFFLSFGAVASAALWGLALLLAVLNAAMFLEGGMARHRALTVAGSALSWLVLAAWWLSGHLAAQAVPAMMIVGGFSLLTLGGHVWSAARTDDASTAHSGLALALVGHLFLLFVAAQPSLSIPPWPVFGVLAVLDLAIGVAALYVRRGEVHLGAVLLTQAILTLWVVAAGGHGWTTVGATAATITAVFSLSWPFLAYRRGVDATAARLFDAAAVTGGVLAQLLLIVATVIPNAPGPYTLAAFHTGLVVAMLAFATAARVPWVALAAVVPAWLATWSYQALHHAPDEWWQSLVLATPLYTAFAAYPLVLWRWVGRRMEPHLAAVLASASFFHVARLALVAGGYGDVIGALPVVQAAVLAALLAGLLRIEAPGERALGRLALVAGAALAFVTVAIPLQLEKEWVTIAWALEGAALAWLFRRIPHRGLFWSAVALTAVVFVRLALNPDVLTYEPRGTMRVFNWYLYTYLLCAGACFAAGALLSKTDDRLGPALPRASTLLPGAATVLLFLLLNIEIADYFSLGPSITFNLSAGLAQDLTYTLGWAAFAVSMLVAGIWKRSRAARMAAILLLTVTVLKGFLHDMARLGGLYRVFSFVGLAVCLSLVALVLQRFVLSRKDGAAE